MPALPRFALFDGRVQPYGEARIGLLTHALHYGTGVFAGVRAYWSAEEGRLHVFRLPDHVLRGAEVVPFHEDLAVRSWEKAAKPAEEPKPPLEPKPPEAPEVPK